MFDAKMNVPEAPLHRAEFEHDNCGIGAVVNIKGTKTRETVENALKIWSTGLERMQRERQVTA